MNNTSSRYIDAYKDQRRGMVSWVSDKLDDILKEYKDEIIDAAAEKLAERLSRTKRAKEVLDEHV